MKSNKHGENKTHSEGGYIVVETVGAFVPFILLIASILSLVNIVAVQARVHYALTQTANTLSMYCYTLELTGVANNMTVLANKADRVASEANAMKNDITSVISGLDSFSGVFDAAGDARRVADRASGWGGNVTEDPAAALGLLMNYGISELSSAFFEQLARPIVGKYLAVGEMTGDAYLTDAGVVNRHTGSSGLGALEFYRFTNLGIGNSKLITRNGDVRLTVEYEIMYTFGKLRLPFSPTLKVTQTVITKAWLNGSGEGYRGN